MAEESLRPEYFVTRTDGKMVPLITVDELPHHIIIRGVKRIMSPFDIVGMTNVGHSSPRHRHHEVFEAAELAPGRQATGGLALKARYFLTRDSGNMVPLVAMDEMPEHFVVNGVTREVSAYEIAGMTCAGISSVRERPHLVEDVNMVPLSYSADRLAVDFEVADNASIVSTPSPCAMEEATTVVDSTVPFVIPSRRITVSTPPTPEIETPPAASSSPSDTSEYPQPSQAVLSQDNKHTSGKVQFVPGKKTLCSFWLRRGECDYSQQGCMFLHEMPLTLEELKMVGLRDIPRWYRDKHGLGSFLAAGGSGAGFGDQALRSATALGVHDGAGEAKGPGHLASNWRSGPQEQVPTPQPTFNRRGNTYNPRASRTNMPSGNFSNPFSTLSTAPMISGPLRSNETLQSRQQLNTLHQMDVHARAKSHRQKHAADRRSAVSDVGDSSDWTAERDPKAGHNRRASSSTMASDVEAAAIRQDAERKAREDAEYARTTMNESHERAAAGVTTPVGINVGQNGTSRVGAKRTGRGGNAKRGRGSGSGRLSAVSRDAA